MLGLIGWGTYSATQLALDAVPDITNNQVQVVTVSPALAPEEMEQFVTFPVELAMANLPSVEEIRSISRYGLSVVTIVFEEDFPILDARQLVSEQILKASEEIPSGMGSPELMPITTGLGEIYQYTLEISPDKKHLYNAMELRSIQDWIVKRQLSGIPGIVEVSSFGGYLKQYEVSVNSQSLQSFGLSLLDVISALEKSNQNIGGGYLNDGQKAYAIRAEGLIKSPSDIEQIVIKSINGVPILISQVAEVTFGSALRYGAMTKDGKGEAVGGITLMLKGANSSKTIDLVKAKVAEVQKSLPDGVSIVPYLDRSKLVDKTIATVSKNLIEGGLIVIFVLVLLLGNFRAGLIVASVIPLAMLFALAMMHIFGISANLMSLGAIDFGIVVDGSVIIVESILHYFHKTKSGTKLTQDQMDESVFSAAAKIRTSAAFGEIIILIVYLPILALTGIEGKTFGPMAQTVSFAILGAFILSLTYVPMMSALFLKKEINHKENFSDKIIAWLQRGYMPLLSVALSHARKTVLIALSLFILTVMAFLKMGGEFIPTLEEGDLAMQITLPPGSSLEESIKTSTKAEKILLDNFPEVTGVISKIGTAEIPTDPMSVEEADVMILLKEKDEWVSADNREDLADLMKEKLSVLVHASFDFTQPIQLRFNELMTGVKTDIAVKIYGDDLNVLSEKAQEAARMIRDIDGAGDIKVEQIEGSPQYRINYQPTLMARYGLQVSEVNQVVKAAIGGAQTGVVYEGERRFDLVVRLREQERQTLELSSLMIPLTDGSSIPLSQVAEVSQQEGPLQISRENTNRRITIGINVRNRDVESLVNEINKKLSKGLQLDPGYYVTYGGQFENLKNAEKRLAVAVPIALLLIIILLYFTFRSVKYTLMIFTAVPLSAIGGVGALYLRGMPFSISAGVGFIALFGVAVLNGIVLISYLNSLKEEKNMDLISLIKEGAKVRLRPVIMTAAVASMGFLPMALSNSAGAEVQKPLATVVIGGLITATLLTLLVLPALYYLGEVFSFKTPKKSLLLILCLFSASLLYAQDAKELTLAEAKAYAIAHHPLVESAELAVSAQRLSKKESFALGMTDLNYTYGQQNFPQRDPYFEINQNLGSIPAHLQRAKKASAITEFTNTQKQLTIAQLSYEVSRAYQETLFRQSQLDLIKNTYVYYERFDEKAALRFATGEISLLERTTAQTNKMALSNQLLQAEQMLSQAMQALKYWLFSEEDIILRDSLVSLNVVEAPHAESTLMWQLQQAQVQVASQEIRVQKSQLFPELNLGYFVQNISDPAGPFTGLNGFKVGLSVPIWFVPNSAKIQQSKIAHQQAQIEMDRMRFEINRELQQLQSNQILLTKQLAYYEEYALQQATQLEETAQIQYDSGQASYIEYLQSLSTAMNIRLQHLETIFNYNDLILKIDYYNHENQ